ncbi:hypothetical protein ACWFRB_17175 [Rhodococcus sp. NPDC055112]
MGYSHNGRGTPIDRVWPTDVDPTYGAGGLVSVRPEGGAIDYDPPFHTDYFWVALLDPVELSAADPNADTVIRLDVQAGVCVSVRHLGDSWCGQEGDVRILAVDEPMAAELFERRRVRRW